MSALRASTRKKCGKCRHKLLSYVGPCLEGCGRPGRRRSGYCKACNHVLYAKRRRQTKLLKDVLGEGIPIDWLARFFDEPRAQAYVRRMLLAIVERKMTLVRHGNPYWLRGVRKRA